MTTTMALQPLALSLLGVDPPRRRNGEGIEIEGQAVNGRPTRTSRRAASYYNTFQTSCSTCTDNPPAYAIATRHRPAQRGDLEGGGEILPKYTCTVAAEARVLLNIEAVSPLHEPVPSEWRVAYLVLRGTLLNFHKAKDSGPGRLLRSYTLQHAEVGLAPDVQHVTLEPRTKLAHMVPSAARRRAWMKDPNMFEPVRQYAMRLRLETDQIVLASSCEEKIHGLFYAISSGIDVSCAIDERSIPRLCTVPRRRRRHRQAQPTNLQDPALLAEQERILRDMYPGFAERAVEQLRPELGRTITTITGGTAVSDLNEPLRTPAREEEEIDLSMIREEEEEPEPLSHSPTTSPLRPTFMRSITDTSVNTTFSGDCLYATSPDNFAPDTGKWQPPHTRDPQQIQRYIKRCLPVLLAESARASDILVSNGKRVRVNFRMEMLEEWELQPPSYKSHGFANVHQRHHQQHQNEVEGRPSSLSQNSVSGAEIGTAQTSTSVLGVENEGEDQITRAENGLAHLELDKVLSNSANDKGVTRTGAAVANAKRHETREAADAIHGVVFCF